MLLATPIPTLIVFTAWTGSDDEGSEDEENYQNNGEGGNHEEGEFTQQQVEEGSEDEEDEEGEGADTIWDRKLAAALESNGAKEFVLQQEL